MMYLIHEDGMTQKAMYLLQWYIYVQSLCN